MQRTSKAWRISSEWANKMGQSWSITHGKQKHKHVILQKQTATVTARTLGCVGINCVKSLCLKVNQGQTKQNCRNRSWLVFPTANFFTLMTFEKTSHCISGSPYTCSVAEGRHWTFAPPASTSCGGAVIMSVALDSGPQTRSFMQAGQISTNWAAGPDVHFGKRLLALKKFCLLKGRVFTL